MVMEAISDHLAHRIIGRLTFLSCNPYLDSYADINHRCAISNAVIEISHVILREWCRIIPVMRINRSKTRLHLQRESISKYGTGKHE